MKTSVSRSENRFTLQSAEHTFASSTNYDARQFSVRDPVRFLLPTKLARFHQRAQRDAI
jgi:hypothetical protein